MAQYTVRAEKSRERLKAEDKKKGRLIIDTTEAVVTDLDKAVDTLTGAGAKFRRGKKTSRKRGERE